MITSVLEMDWDLFLSQHVFELVVLFLHSGVIRNGPRCLSHTQTCVCGHSLEGVSYLAVSYLATPNLFVDWFNSIFILNKDNRSRSVIFIQVNWCKTMT